MKALLSVLLFLPLFLSAQTVDTELDGSLSSTGDNITYRWRQLRGPTAKMLTPDSIMCKLEGLQEGLYQYELTVCAAYTVPVEVLCAVDSVFINVIRGVLAINPEPSKPDRPGIETKLEFALTTNGGKLRFGIRSPKRIEMYYAVYDIVGRVLVKGTFNLVQGINTHDVPATLTRGIYIVKVGTYFDNITKRIVVH